MTGVSFGLRGKASPPNLCGGRHRAMAALFYCVIFDTMYIKWTIEKKIFYG